ncbi:hypothetical protein AHAS_Ahas18G0157600 [Arachis hypogaea]
MGVARQLYFPEREIGGQPYGRATWYRRRGMPATIFHFGVLLESQAWHASSTNQQEEDLGVPLEFWAWHASEGAKHINGRGTPDPGRATLVQFSREKDQAHIMGVVLQNLGTMLVQLSRSKEEREKAWACHLRSKAWHARLSKVLKRPRRAT